MEDESDEVIAAHFLTLKKVWDRLLQGEPDVLPAATEAFFIRKTGAYFRIAMEVPLQGNPGPLANLVGDQSIASSCREKHPGKLQPMVHR